MTQEPSKSYFLFNLIGLFSSLSLMLIFVYLLPGAVQGDFGVVVKFFDEYPGSEPFVIFIAPIILIMGPVWTWQKIRSARKKTTRKDS